MTDLLQIPISKIVLHKDAAGNSLNPRRNALPGNDLDSMGDYRVGQLTPIIVNFLKESGEYELVAGHRRLIKARSLGWNSIAAQVRTDITATNWLLIAVASNQSKPLSPLERAYAAINLARDGHKDPIIAKTLGTHAKGLDRLKDLSRAHQVVQMLVDKGKMSWTAFDKIRKFSQSEQLVIITKAKSKAKAKNGRITADVVKSARIETEHENTGAPMVGDDQTVAQVLNEANSLIAKVRSMNLARSEKIQAVEIVDQMITSLTGWNNLLTQDLKG